MRRPTLAVGDVIHVSEPDYCYGIGDLYLRITQLPPGSLDPHAEWGDVFGVDVHYDGTIGHERRVSVRLAAVRVTPRDQLAGD